MAGWEILEMLIADAILPRGRLFLVSLQDSSQVPRSDR